MDAYTRSQIGALTRIAGCVRTWRENDDAEVALQRIRAAIEEYDRTVVFTQAAEATRDGVG